MKLKGDWSAETSYDVGDIVRWAQDDRAYYLKNAADAGVAPQNTLYWQKMDDVSNEMLHFCYNVINICLSAIPTNISDSSIELNSSTASSEKVFKITVDDDGELTATELVPE